MLRDVDHRAAEFTAEGNPLQHAQGYQNDRRRNADRTVSRQQSYDAGCSAHQDDGDKKCIFAAHKIADPTEDQCTEWTKQKSRRPSEKCENEALRRVYA